MGTNTPAAAGPMLGGVGCAAAAVLILEVVLTRVFAVAQFYHFAFLTVSLALLGFGASGSALAAFPRLGRGGPRRWAVLAAAQAVTTVGAYVVVNELPFDSFSIAWDRRQVAYLAAYYFALTVPFFFGGTVIGTLLAGWDQPAPVPSRQVYAATLAGSGLGALVALGALGRLSGPGVVLLAAAVAAAAAVAFEAAAPARSRGRLAAWLALLVALVVAAAAPPASLRLDLSPYKGLSAALRLPDAELVSTDWSAAARVDHVRSGSIRSLPGLSFAYPGAPPPQDGVTFDGDDLAPVPRVAPADADFVPFLLGSLPFALRPGGDVAVLEPRGGLDVVVALAAGARSVTAVEPSRAAREAAAAGADPYGDPRVTVVAEETRSFAERTGERFDVVDLALTAPYRPVTSGAYSLAEEYELTVEAFGRYFDLLRPGGVVAAMRWAQTPPSEETRLLALVAATLRDRGADPAVSVAMLRGYANVLVLAAPDGLGPADVAAIREFAGARRFDLVSLPGLQPGETNRFNVLPDDEYAALARAVLADPGEVYRIAEFELRPPTDDRPFFGHYFRWGQAGDVLEGLGRTWQPFGGAGYFVLLALLALSVVGALALIVAPLLVGRMRPRAATPAGAGVTWWTFGYFGLLGIAFLFVEIPIIQRYILLIGRPTTAVAIVLFALLLASGAGSLASARVPWRAAAGGVVALSAAYPFLIPVLTDALLPAPGPVRMLAGALALAPLGFFMGTMFPRGLAHLEGRAPQLVPWAWGVNGTASVISAAAAAVLALSFGFRFVILAGAACYAGAALLARGETSV